MTRATIIEIDNYLVSSDLITEQFACNLQECSGACCVIGESGAPLKEEEAEALEREYPNYAPYLPQRGIKAIEKQGFSIIDVDGELVTPLVKRGEECAYAIFEEGNCLCGVERAYFDGKSSFRKPISCWLYPVRVSTLSNGMIALNVHRWSLCDSAYKRGKEEGIPLYKFLKEALIEEFGDSFYKTLEATARHLGK